MSEKLAHGAAMIRHHYETTKKVATLMGAREASPVERGYLDGMKSVMDDPSLTAKEIRQRRDTLKAEMAQAAPGTEQAEYLYGKIGGHRYFLKDYLIVLQEKTGVVFYSDNHDYCMSWALRTIDDAETDAEAERRVQELIATQGYKPMPPGGIVIPSDPSEY